MDGTNVDLYDDSSKPKIVKLFFIDIKRDKTYYLISYLY